MQSLNTHIITLYENQLRDWEQANINYDALRNVQTREIQFKDHSVFVQHNPKRIISSAAKVDPQSISERPCFLCSHNRPSEQQGIPYGNDLTILINPFPVFHRHLTIPSLKHLPQRIAPNFRVMLELARDLQDYTILYNGPNCGASAPDHFHFQAIQGGVLPIEKDFLSGIKCRLKGKRSGTDIYTWIDYLRKPLTLSGDDPDSIQSLFTGIYLLLHIALPSLDEPMMNMLANYRNDRWIIHIFPRKQHRPRQYHEKDENQLLLSPASIDMGGVLIMPREEDYRKISKEVIDDVYSQVCVDDPLIQNLIYQLKQVV
jgi:hypothetical protein